MEETLVNGIRVRYEQRGEQFPRDTVVLFLHGWGASGASFGQLPDEAGRRYFTLVPDLPGFGGSSEPPEPWDVSTFCEFALAFLQPFAPKEVILIGHSYGGRMCIKLGARKDLPFAVRKMILFDAAGIRPKRTLGYHLRVGSYKLGKRILALPPVRALFPHAEEAFRASHGSADYRAASPVMRASMVKAVNEDLRGLLPHISASTLLVWGTADTATPLSDGELMERLIPDAGLVKLNGAGHFSFADCPVPCKRVLCSFLGIDG